MARFLITFGPDAEVLCESMRPANPEDRLAVRFLLVEEESGIDYDVYGVITESEPLTPFDSQSPNWELTLRVTDGCATTGKWGSFKCGYNDKTRTGVIKADDLAAA